MCLSAMKPVAQNDYSPLRIITNGNTTGYDLQQLELVKSEILVIFKGTENF